MRKNYNKKFYGLFKTANGAVRDKFSPDPFESTGRIGSKIGGKLIKKPVHLVVFFITGLFYNKKKAKPYKGSIIYTIVKWGVLLLFGMFVAASVAMFGRV